MDSRVHTASYWPNADAVGKPIRLDGCTGPSVEIVGVAETIKYQTTSDRFRAYARSQHPVARMVLMGRSSGNSLELVQPLKDIVRTFDANLPMLQTSSYMELYLNQAVSGPRIAMDVVAAMRGGWRPSGRRRFVWIGGAQC
jgi:hypothetical protein